MRPTIGRLAILLAVSAIPARGWAASARPFDYPGAAATCGTAISSNGQVVGLALGGSLATVTPFLFSNGVFSRPGIDLPGARVLPAGMNKWGSLVGSATNLATGRTTRFLARHGVTTRLADWLTLTAINDNGDLLGAMARQPVVPGVWYIVGVVQPRGGEAVRLDDGTGNTHPTGMDVSAGHVVGYSFAAAGQTAWYYHHGVFTPLAVPGALQTMPVAVGSTGRVAGTFYTGAVGAPVAHGFFIEAGNTTVWDVPGASATQITGMNAAGQLTGCFTDQTGVHGMIAVP